MLTGQHSLLRGVEGFAALRSWRAERMSLVRFAPLALLLGFAACLGGQAGWTALLGTTCVGLLLLIQFRLWDDLVDANRDRLLHPERVLAVRCDHRVFVFACIVLAVVNAYALHAMGGRAAAAGFVLLNVLLGGWYRLHSTRGLVHLHVLPLKYPAFVALLGLPVWSPSMFAGAAAIYAAVCLFDLIDRDGCRTPGLKVLLLLHGAALVVLASLPNPDGVGVATGSLVAVLVVYACLDGSRRRIARTVRGHAPFVAALLILVRLFLGGIA